MEKYLKINLDEARTLRTWFLCVTSEGFDAAEDYELNEILKKFIEKTEEKRDNGKRLTENNQRK